jgi:nucleotide-binding universal stress UspA family protein
MISYKRILVPVDFSEPSKKAVTYGLTIAAQTNARLFLAHIVPDTVALNYAFPSETYDIEKRQYETAKREIGTLVPEKYAARFDVHTIVKTGRIDSELLGVVRDESIDLVVMGTHGRRGLGRWFIGSVTESMLRKVPVPVLTVSHLGPETHAIELGFASIKKILYATDLSESSVAGMQYAIELARGTGARLTVAHVIDHANFVLLSGTAAAYLEASRIKLVESVKRRLNELIMRDKPPDVEIEPLLLEGKPYEQVLRISEGRAMDIIVLNLQSKKMLDRAFLGSTAERVVRLAHVPVLSVPAALVSNP